MASHGSRGPAMHVRRAPAPLLRAGLAAFVLVCAAGAGAAEPQPRPFSRQSADQEAIYRSLGEKVPAGYTVDRSLLTYATTLLPSFRRDLAALRPDERWLDVGAGEGRAVVDYCTARYDAMLRAVGHTGEKAKAVAVSIEDRRGERWHSAAACLDNDGIRYLFGRRLREYSPQELGRFQLITDVLGAFSYTRYPWVYLEKALGLLTVGGTLHTLLQDVRAEAGGNQPFYPGSSFLTEIRARTGEELKVCEWLKRIACVEVTCAHTPLSTPPVEVYGIRKTCDAVSVPPLELTHFESGTPPERHFRAP